MLQCPRRASHNTWRAAHSDTLLQSISAVTGCQLPLLSVTVAVRYRCPNRLHKSPAWKEETRVSIEHQTPVMDVPPHSTVEELVELAKDRDGWRAYRFQLRDKLSLKSPIQWNGTGVATEQHRKAKKDR